MILNVLKSLKCPKRQLKRSYYTVKSQINLKNEPNLVSKQIYMKIKATGPITVADYMKEVLTNPLGGYYMNKDMFGEYGDFVTSPELNQMFGEMISIWLLNEWSKMGCPKPIQIVELGPGKGSLSGDILRIFKHFDALEFTSLHLVEISPFLSNIQAKRLCLQSQNVNNALFYKEGIHHEGTPIRWYKHLSCVPQEFSLIVAHEFFDALPIHKFQKTEQGYREVLIDIDSSVDVAKFRYVLAKDTTPMLDLFLLPNEKRPHFEVSPDGLILCQHIAKRLVENGGIALMADYGHNGTGTDTFRAFKKHKLHDVLTEPGTADLTADVDFSRFKKMALESNDVLTFGPVLQRDFLLKMGIEHRFKALKEVSERNEKEQVKGLTYGYNMMIDEDKMGERFKFFAMFPGVVKKIFDRFPPVGFS